MIAEATNKYFIEELLEKLILGSEHTPRIMEKLLNQLMLAERESVLGAGPYERTEDRKGFANGFKDRKYLSKIGDLSLRVPQTRDIPFYPSCLEKGERTERALMLAFAEAYVQGVSTRDVGKIVEELCGRSISSTTVSEYAKVLDKDVQAFKERPLCSYKYLYLDAQYEKVRYEGIVRSMAVLKAVGVGLDGRREVLGISCSLSEAEVHWRTFLQDLLKRGLIGVELVISDDHSGLKAALRAVLPSVKWQRCIFHLDQNAEHHSPSKTMRTEIHEAVKSICGAQDRVEAESRLKKAVEKFESKASKFCNWLEENFLEGLTFYDFLKKHWRKIRTVNAVERINREQKRRTRVAGLFPSVESCERLVVSIGIRIHEDWATGKQGSAINQEGWREKVMKKRKNRT
ncbi:MAG: IS256 family transposase [Verrucomicrobia bacterium]|nr:IS256 family transposase [Verrucomicrobiota bacterium]